MREWCGCGAGIHATARQVAKWRTNHRPDNDTGPDQVQVPPTGSDSRTELSYAEIDLGAHIGFRPND